MASKLRSILVENAKGRQICISSGDMSVICELNGTRTAKALFKLATWGILETARLQGEELYFLVAIRAWFRFVPDLVRHREVQRGTLAYWPRGGYLCLFFGPLPHNPPDKIMPVAPVVVVGKIIKGLDQLGRFENPSMIQVKILLPNNLKKS